MSRIAWLAALSLFALAATAEQVYVSDKLVVNVYAEANQESEKVASLDSGDAVDAIEKAEGYTHVKLSDGREGWVKSSYLSAQTPAVVRLKELEKEKGSSANTATAALTEELKQLKEHNASLRGEVEALKSAASKPTMPAASPALSATASEVAVEPSSAASESKSATPAHILKWTAAIGLAGGVFGFAFGYRSLAKRIERKYGKLKIY